MMVSRSFSLSVTVAVRMAGEKCVLDELCVIENGCDVEGGTMTVGSCNHFGIGCRVVADALGDGNVFDVKARVAGVGLSTLTGCCFGTLW